MLLLIWHFNKTPQKTQLTYKRVLSCLQCCGGADIWEPHCKKGGLGVQKRFFVFSRILNNKYLQLMFLLLSKICDLC